MMKNHYETLQVETFAPYEVISKSYKKLILLHHPDKQQQSNDAFIKVREREGESKGRGVNEGEEEKRRGERLHLQDKRPILHHPDKQQQQPNDAFIKRTGESKEGRKERKESIPCSSMPDKHYDP